MQPTSWAQQWHARCALGGGTLVLLVATACLSRLESRNAPQAIVLTSRTSRRRISPRGGEAPHLKQPLQLASGLQLWQAPTLSALRGFPDALVLGWLQNSHRRNALVKPASTALYSAASECLGPASPLQQQLRCRFAVSDQFVYEDAIQPDCAAAAAIENHRRYAAAHGYSFCHTSNLDPKHRTPHNSFMADAQFNKLRRVRALLKHHEWVLQLDLDAIFVDFTATLEDIVSHWAGAGHEGIDLLFSGNKLVINSGVLLFRRSPWTDNLLTETVELGVSLGTWTKSKWRDAERGPGGDNWALAVVLAGCNRSSSAAELTGCYRRADGGNGNDTFTESIYAGKQAVADTALSADAAKRMRVLPRALFQSYQAAEAQFVLHYPGSLHLHSRLLWRLMPVAALNRFKWDAWPLPQDAKYPKEHAIALALRATSCKGGRLAGCFSTKEQYRRHCQAAEPDLYPGWKTLLDEIEGASETLRDGMEGT